MFSSSASPFSNRSQTNDRSRNIRLQIDRHGKNPAPANVALEDQLVAAWDRFVLESVRTFAPQK